MSDGHNQSAKTSAYPQKISDSSLGYLFKRDPHVLPQPAEISGGRLPLGEKSPGETAGGDGAARVETFLHCSKNYRMIVAYDAESCLCRAGR